MGGFKRVVEAFRVPGQGNHGGSENNRSKRSKTSVPAVMKRLGSAEEAEGRPGEQVSERNCFFPQRWRLRNAFGTLYAARRSFQSAGARKSRRVAHSGFYSDPAGHNRRDVACGGSQGAPGWPMAVFPRSRRLGGVFMTLCAAPGRVWSAGASKSP